MPWSDGILASASAYRRWYADAIIITLMPGWYCFHWCRRHYWFSLFITSLRFSPPLRHDIFITLTRHGYAFRRASAPLRQAADVSLLPPAFATIFSLFSYAFHIAARFYAGCRFRRRLFSLPLRCLIFIFSFRHYFRIFSSFSFTFIFAFIFFQIFSSLAFRYFIISAVFFDDAILRLRLFSVSLRQPPLRCRRHFRLRWLLFRRFSFFHFHAAASMHYIADYCRLFSFSFLSPLRHCFFVISSVSLFHYLDADYVSLLSSFHFIAPFSFSPSRRWWYLFTLAAADYFAITLLLSPPVFDYFSPPVFRRRLPFSLRCRYFSFAPVSSGFRMLTPSCRLSPFRRRRQLASFSKRSREAAFSAFAFQLSPAAGSASSFQRQRQRHGSALRWVFGLSPQQTAPARRQIYFGQPGLASVAFFLSSLSFAFVTSQRDATYARLFAADAMAAFATPFQLVSRRRRADSFWYAGFHFHHFDASIAAIRHDTAISFHAISAFWGRLCFLSRLIFSSWHSFGFLSPLRHYAAIFSWAPCCCQPPRVSSQSAASRWLPIFYYWAAPLSFLRQASQSFHFAAARIASFRRRAIIGRHCRRHYAEEADGFSPPRLPLPPFISFSGFRLSPEPF